VKKTAFKTAANRHGFIEATVAPVGDKHECRFGWGDILTLIALIVGILALARVVLTH
jgi:hypothetical protein